MTRRIALILEYEGTRYAGFQFQPGAPTIQGEVEQALEKLTGTRPRVTGAGRTDAGVHALAQVAAFDTKSSLAIHRFQLGMDYYLPDDIGITAAYEMPAGFDPRRDAVARVYRYTLVEARTRSPLRRRFSYQVGRRVDEQVMAAALAHLVGERDFGPFSGRVPDDRSTVRRMFRAEVWRAEDRRDEVHLEFEANAFLPQQVRRTAAAVLMTGIGKLSWEAFRALADSNKRGAVVQVLPAKGLCLRRVKYQGFPPESHAASTDHQTHEERRA